MKFLHTLMLAGSLVCFNSSGLVSSIAAQAATQPASRIDFIGGSARSPLTGSRPPQALAADDAGPLSGGTRLEGMGLLFSRSAQQNADLEGLIAAQQNPASPLYHQWLTPQEFGQRFGMSDADLAKASAWLEQQGFTVTGVSNSRNRINFNGTASQVNNAFATELHRFASNGKTNFAPAQDLTLPAGLAETVAAVTNLSSFRPTPPIHSLPNFTSSISGSHFFTPGDVETAYDVKAAYSAGYTGAGQSIAIVGQSAVQVSDITNFQNAEGLTPKAPTMVLVPGSGVSTLFAFDQGESDLDLEYSGSIAKDATIFFVYVGDNTNYQVSDSIAYAVDNRIAPVISASYGYCEAANGSTFLNAVNLYLQQAAAQGQSVIASSGDSGSSGCYGYGGAYDSTLQVAWPGSSQYVTAVGGTEISPANNISSTYWAPANGVDVISSALSYIPEIAWNDSNSSGLGSSGGGTSLYFPKPSWQTGVPGIPSGASYRLVPDIALYSSGGYPGYLYCSSDTAETSVSGSCANGFRDIADDTLTVAGGTSFAAPIFAGMVALINQATNSTGQGVLGSTLYPLAANATTYANAFHDITSGTNECPASSGICSTATEGAYTTGVGYDEVTGLGSIDLFKLIGAWPRTPNSALALATTTLTAATPTPGVGNNDLITITVAHTANGSGTPSGTIGLLVDGTAVATPLTLSGGTASYTFSTNTAGSHTITANYSGDSTFAANTASLVLTVAYVPSAVTLTPAAQNPVSGVADPITITIGPASSNSGTTATPTGTVSIANDGIILVPALALTNGTASYTLLSSAVGSHTLTVAYVGDYIFAPSTASFAYTISAPKSNSSVTVTAASATVANGASDKLTISVAPAAGGNTTTPTGTVGVSVDGTVVNPAFSLTSGSASYVFSSTVAGQHTVSATYSGDSLYLTSTASTTITVSAAPTFTLSATNITLTAGSTGTSTVTVTPQNGYTGTIGWKLSGNPTVPNACYTIANSTVTGPAVTATVTINTSNSGCTKGFHSGGTHSAAIDSPSGRGPAPALALFAAVGAVFFARRRRGLGALLSLTLLGATLTVSGCGTVGTSVTPTPPPTPTYPTTPGTYTLTLTGTDTASSTITAATTFTLTVQ
jgi:subtilase family serine protease